MFHEKRFIESHILLKDANELCYMSLSSSEFLENEFSESHTLLKGFNEILPIFNTRSRFEQKIGIGVRKIWWSDFEFGKSRRYDSSTC